MGGNIKLEAEKFPRNSDDTRGRTDEAQLKKAQILRGEVGVFEKLGEVHRTILALGRFCRKYPNHTNV